MTKIGIIGIGGVADYAHIPAYLFNEIEIVAISDINELELERVGNKYGIERRYTNPEDLIMDKDVHLVDIATPPSSHLSLLQLCNEFDKKVVMQKPLICDTSKCEDMYKEIISSRAFVLNTSGRYVSAWKKVKGLLGDQEIGNPLMCTIINNDWWDREVQRWDHSIKDYIIFEMAIHHLDLCMFWFGKPIKVAARGGANPNQCLKEMNWVSIMLEYESGFIVNIVENWSMSEYCFSDGHPFENILITGDEGVIRANSERVEVSHTAMNTVNVWHHPRPGQVLPGENLESNWFIDSFGLAMRDYISKLEYEPEINIFKNHSIDLTNLVFSVVEATKSDSWIDIN